MKIATTNRKASFNYTLENKLECGIQLVGSEVKSIRLGQVNINDSFVSFRGGEAFIINMYIGSYEKGSAYNEDERRKRKLLMHSSEIAKFEAKIKQKGYAVIPTKVYFVGSLVKVEVALARGKKTHDKKQTLKERDIAREMDKEIVRHKNKQVN